MTKEKLIPELRFPGFEGEWVEKLFGDIATFSKGKGISKNEICTDGETECIRYGELYTYYREVIDKVISKTSLDPTKLILSEKNDVIIPASGETQIDIATASCILKKGVALGGDLNIIKSEINGVFLSYYLNNAKKTEIANLAQGISVIHLYSNQLKTLILTFPQSEEQQKIASFLTSVDKRISLLTQKKEKLEQYKKGVMQKIFNQEIRFKDDGKDFPDWEEKKVGELGQFIGGGTPDSTIENYWKGNVPWISSSDISEYSIHKINIARFISDEAIKESATKLIKKNSVLIVSRVGIGKFAIASTNLCTSQDFTNLTLDESKYDPFFICYYFSASKNKFISLAQGTSIKGFTGEDIRNLKFNIPTSLKEQQKIATFLSALDKQIEQVDRLIVQTGEWKKGLLQKMFV